MERTCVRSPQPSTSYVPFRSLRVTPITQRTHSLSDPSGPFGFGSQLCSGVSETEPARCHRKGSTEPKGKQSVLQALPGCLSLLKLARGPKMSKTNHTAKRPGPSKGNPIEIPKWCRVRFRQDIQFSWDGQWDVRPWHPLSTCSMAKPFTPRCGCFHPPPGHRKKARSWVHKGAHKLGILKEHTLYKGHWRAGYV